MGPQAVAAASTTRLHAVQRDQMELLLDRQGAVGGRSLPSAAASTSRRLDGFAWRWRVSTQALARCSVQILSFSSELNSLRRVSHNSHYRCTLFCFVCLCFFFLLENKDTSAAASVSYGWAVTFHMKLKHLFKHRGKSSNSNLWYSTWVCGYLFKIHTHKW